MARRAREHRADPLKQRSTSPLRVSPSATPVPRRTGTGGRKLQRLKTLHGVQVTRTKVMLHDDPGYGCLVDAHAAMPTERAP